MSVTCPLCGTTFAVFGMTTDREWRQCARWLFKHTQTHVLEPEWVI